MKLSPRHSSQMPFTIIIYFLSKISQNMKIFMIFLKHFPHIRQRAFRQNYIPFTIGYDE